MAPQGPWFWHCGLSNRLAQSGRLSRAAEPRPLEQDRLVSLLCWVKNIRACHMNIWFCLYVGSKKPCPCYKTRLYFLFWFESNTLMPATRITYSWFCFMYLVTILASSCNHWMLDILSKRNTSVLTSYFISICVWSKQKPKMKDGIFDPPDESLVENEGSRLVGSQCNPI